MTSSRNGLKNLMTLVLSVLLVIGVVLAGGCVRNETFTPSQETPTQIIEDTTPDHESATRIAEDTIPDQEPPTQITRVFRHITAQQAFTLIQDNQDNPDFVVIDLRTPEQFADEHIGNAINLHYYSETFRDELDKLDKNRTYLIYYRCSCGGIGGKTLDLMAELNFREVYNIARGLNQWRAEGLPTIKIESFESWGDFSRLAS